MGLPGAMITGLAFTTESATGGFSAGFCCAVSTGLGGILLLVVSGLLLRPSVTPGLGVCCVLSFLMAVGFILVSLTGCSGFSSTVGTTTGGVTGFCTTWFDCSSMIVMLSSFGRSIC